MYIDKHGYYRDRLGLVHRQIANEWWLAHFGVPLPRTLVVHHINCDRLDNRVENFAYLTRSEHRALHCAIEGMRIGAEAVKRDSAYMRKYHRDYCREHIERIRELKRNWQRKHRHELKTRNAGV